MFIFCILSVTCGDFILYSPIWAYTGNTVSPYLDHVLSL